jgi:ABC-type Na+ transport system ATPase subunit NatA
LALIVAISTRPRKELAVIAYDVQHVVKYYPKQKQPANKDVTLQVDKGEIFGILGDNGAGKTTLVRQMVNLLRPTSGRIALFGQDVASDPLYVSMNVGYMPQETHALNNLTVGEALYFTAHLRGLSRADARRERDGLMALWQMERLRDKYSSRLSGGERRLLRLAAAMAGAVPVLILDEPTNDLAPQRRSILLRWRTCMSITRPSHRPERRHHPVLVQLVDLFLMELTNWRWSWRHVLLSGTITPLFTIVALGVFARDGGRETLVYVMTGNIVVSLLFGTMNNVQGHVEFLRFQGGLDYLATLPV